MIGEKLKTLREKKGISRKEAGEILGIDQSTYGKYELGKRMPDYDTLAKICRIYDVSVAFLLGEGIYKNAHITVKHFDIVIHKIKSDLSHGPLYDFLASNEFENYPLTAKLAVLSAFVKEIHIDEEKKNLQITYYQNKNPRTATTEGQFDAEFEELYRNLSKEQKAQVQGFIKGLLAQ